MPTNADMAPVTTTNRPCPGDVFIDGFWNYKMCNKHGSLNVPIEHHPTIRYMVYNGYYKVMSNIPKMGHLPIFDKHP